MKVINLFGGCGIGKSTTAAGLFFKMKSLGYKVELVTEYAKDLTYSESFFSLKDQLMVFARQHHKLWVLKDKVEYAIVDSPLLLSNHYFVDTGEYSEILFKQFVIDTFNRYDNTNILLERNIIEHPYQEYGRTQTLEEAIEIDVSIKNILIKNDIPYQSVISSREAISDILKTLKYKYNDTQFIRYK